MTSRASRGPSRGGGGAALAAGVLSLRACTPEPAIGVPLPPARGGAGTCSALMEQIFVPRCASCHNGSVFPEIDATVGCAGMVNVQSEQAVMDIVEPGEPDQSWLMVRLRGEEGRGTMPSEPLTSAEIAAVEAWIANGAPE